MSHSMKGAVPFEVDGTGYALRLGHNAQVHYEDKTGETVIAAVNAFIPKSGEEERPAARRLRTLFWAGLSHLPDMTEEKAGDLIDALGQAQAGVLLGQAVRLAFPVAEPGKGAPAGNRRRASTRRSPAG